MHPFSHPQTSSPLGACDGLSKEEIDNMSGSDSDEGRPRPIGAEQESEDDESDREVNSNEDGAKSAAAEGAAAAGAAAPGEEKKASKRIKIPAFSENNLITAKGLTKIYEDFPQKCQYKGRGREVGCSTFLSCWEKIMATVLYCTVWTLHLWEG